MCWTSICCCCCACCWACCYNQNVSFFKKSQQVALAYLSLLLGLLLRLLLGSGRGLLSLLLSLLLGSLLRLLLMNHCGGFVRNNCGVWRVWIKSTVDQPIMSVQFSFRGEPFAASQAWE